MSRIDNAIARASLFSPAYREAVDSNYWLDEHGEHFDTLVLDNTLLTESVYIDEGCTLTCNVSPLFVIARQKIINYGTITASQKGTGSVELSNVFDYPSRVNNDATGHNNSGSHSNNPALALGGYSGAAGASGRNHYARHVTGRSYKSMGGQSGTGGPGGEAVLDVFIVCMMERLRQLDFMGFPIGGWGAGGPTGTHTSSRTGTQGAGGVGGNPSAPGGCIVLITPKLENYGTIISAGGEGGPGQDGVRQMHDSEGRRGGGGGGGGASGSGGGSIFIITGSPVHHEPESVISAPGGNGGAGGRGGGTASIDAWASGGAGGVGGLSFINEAPTNGTYGAGGQWGWNEGKYNATGGGGGGGGGGAGGVVLEVVL